MRTVPWIAGSVGMLVLVIAALHATSAAKEAGCPFGPSSHVASQRYEVTTTPRPALGFSLGESTRAKVIAWARSAGLTCRAQHRGGVLECLDGAASSRWFRFDGDTLVGVQSSRRTSTAADVLAAFRTATAVLADRVPTRSDGIASIEALSRGTLRQASVEYRAPAYRAVIRATNMGDGFVLTESYAN